MTYSIQILPSAQRELGALSKRDRNRIDIKILSLASTPRPSGVISLTGLDGLYRLRVGDYRIIYRVVDNDLSILIVKIGHRKDVYRGLGK
ncbi:MAG: type II toxin-antitoxin system RelE family toxin [Desulfomonilaceae bacterium]